MIFNSLPFEWKVISSLLEDIGYRNELLHFSTIPSKLKNRTYLTETLEELDGNKTYLNSEFNFKLIHLFEENKCIVLDLPHFYNKYRLITLRSDFYSENEIHFDLLKHKNHCRTKQEEALKSGLATGIWQSTEAEKYFNQSEDPGYFGGNGSSGWKYIALNNMLLDISMQENKLDFYRFSPYETLLINGQLITLHKLLIDRDSLSKESVQKYICRRLGLQYPDHS